MLRGAGQVSKGVANAVLFRPSCPPIQFLAQSVLAHPWTDVPIPHLKRVSGHLLSLPNSIPQSGLTRYHGGRHAVPVAGRGDLTQAPNSWCSRSPKGKPLISPHSPLKSELSTAMQPTINQTKAARQGWDTAVLLQMPWGSAETVNITQQTHISHTITSWCRFSFPIYLLRAHFLFNNYLGTAYTICQALNQALGVEQGAKYSCWSLCVCFGVRGR